MFFIYTQAYGFETEHFPTVEDAQHTVIELLKLRAYQSKPPKIYWISEAALLANCELAEQ